MNIHISFDYELFFGSDSGSALKCIIEPTQKLIDLSSKYHVPFIFFVDAGYLVQLKKNSHHTACSDDYEAISKQLKLLVSLGHEIGLHIHPHWEDCKFVNNQWQMDTSRYKLACFSEIEVEQIITTYHQAVLDIIGKPCQSYRAGGWCVQPFDFIKKALIKNNIFIDSSVYFKGFHDSQAHSYNFLNAPKKSMWFFENNPIEEHKSGLFKEIPIAYDSISPFFYWNLYFKMRINPSLYKPIGDGGWLVDKKRLYKHFYTSTNHFACADGYFASRLPNILTNLVSDKQESMMVLSHPKSMANYSFKALENFIKLILLNKHQVVTLVR
jgi:peptidoglycan/xylan/chitin deacetylase (PgdA/CDA1 family)